MPSPAGGGSKIENEAALNLKEENFMPSALKKPAYKTVLATFESLVLFAVFAFLQYGELFFKIPLKKVYFQNIKEAAQELSFKSNPYEVVGSGFEKDINVKARVELQKVIESFILQYGSNNRA